MARWTDRQRVKEKETALVPPVGDVLGSIVLEGSATLHSPERRAGILHPPECVAFSKTQPYHISPPVYKPSVVPHRLCLPAPRLRGPARVSPHSGPLSHHSLVPKHNVLSFVSCCSLA